jgi:peptidyl-prolyl cis-trans isomerase SurA
MMKMCNQRSRLFALSYVVVALGFLSVGASSAQAQQVAVIVNGDPITTYDIEQRAKLIQLTTHKAASRQEVIDDLINDKLKVQLGKRYKLEISDPDVDTSFGDMARRMQMNADGLTKTLGAQGVLAYTLKDRIRAEMVWQQIVRGKFQASLQVTEKDVASALQGKDDKDATGYEYSLTPILFVAARGAGDEAIAVKKRDAESLRVRFDSCQTGLPLARSLRDVAVRDPITKTSADLAPALREILDKTQVGRLTDPEVTAQGVELFALCAKKETKVNSAAKREVQNKLFADQFASRSKSLLAEQRKQAMIEYKDGANAPPAGPKRR